LLASRVNALALIALLVFVARARADESWQPLVTQDGVSVQERTSPGRAMPELRAQVAIHARIFQVLAVITDVPNQTKWMHNCTEARRLRADGQDVSVLYNRTAAPWPVADRDTVLRNEITLLEPGKHVAVRFANTTDPAAPPVDGVVRMPRLVGDYDLLAVSPTRTQVTYHLDIDPGGSLPAWAAVRGARDTPLHTLLGLRARVAATQGHYADFVTRWSARH